MTFRLEVRGATPAVRSGSQIRELTQSRTRDRILSEIAKEAAETLRGSKSVWPVATGRSKRGFYAEGTTVRNRENYAVFVEGRQGKARETLEANAEQIVERATKRLPEHLRPS